MKFFKILLIFMLILNLLFMNFNNPLIMSIILIIQTMFINMMMGKIYFTFWFSYVMFLIFIGGLFILFVYIISMIYNNMLFFKKMKFILMISLFFFLLLIINLNYSFYFLNYETNLFNIFLKENYLNMIKFFNFPNNIINLLMISYLFLLMIIVVKITNFLKGPIRTIN